MSDKNNLPTGQVGIKQQLEENNSSGKNNIEKSEEQNSVAPKQNKTSSDIQHNHKLQNTNQTES
jgi:hypothetical protein